MKIQPTPSGSQTTVQAAAPASNFDFQGLLAEATRNLAEGKQDASAEALNQAHAELIEYLKKTPIEHMREAILKEMGLSEEEVAAMPPEQRMTIEATIADKIKERLANGNRDKPTPMQSAQASLMAAAFSLQVKAAREDTVQA